MTYTINEIAKMAGVSTRTLRYYDQIKLLEPAGIAKNGYRYYDRGNLLTLQQILFFRELEIPLKEIQRIMSQPNFNLAEALAHHREALRQRQNRTERLIHTIDQTLCAINRKEKNTMTDKDYFAGFDHSEYEEEARQRWGKTSMYIESQKKWNSYSAEQKEAIKAESRRLTVRMVGKNANTTPDDPDVQAAIGEYLAYLNRYFYTCDADYLRGLADMWVTDPRFAANYERVRKGGAAFVREAVHFYCDHFETTNGPK